MDAGSYALGAQVVLARDLLSLLTKRFIRREDATMMLIDLTAQLGSLMMALDAVLVFAATAIAVSAWHAQRASIPSPRLGSSVRTLAVVGRSSGAPATTGAASSDTSVSEAA